MPSKLYWKENVFDNFGILSHTMLSTDDQWWGRARLLASSTRWWLVFSFWFGSCGVRRVESWIWGEDLRSSLYSDLNWMKSKGKSKISESLGYHHRIVLFSVGKNSFFSLPPLNVTCSDRFYRQIQSQSIFIPFTASHIKNCVCMKWRRRSWVIAVNFGNSTETSTILFLSKKALLKRIPNLSNYLSFQTDCHIFPAIRCDLLWFIVHNFTFFYRSQKLFSFAQTESRIIYIYCRVVVACDCSAWNEKCDMKNFLHSQFTVEVKTEQEKLLMLWKTNKQ